MASNVFFTFLITSFAVNIRKLQWGIIHTKMSYPEESAPGGTGSWRRTPSSEYCASEKTYCVCTSHHLSSPSGLERLDVSR